LSKPKENEYRFLEKLVKKLQSENKAIEKQKKYWWRECLKRDEQLDKIKESRNDLLEGLKDARLLCQYLSKHEKTFNDNIQKAEAQKEKEK